VCPQITQIDADERWQATRQVDRENVMKEGITEQVRSKYAEVAGAGLSSRQEGVRLVAEAFGYSPEELTAIPAEANMGLSCGNPTAFASLKPGEVVVDLGCGGGLDVFLAARQVGATGKAIGIDMTPEMIELALRNAAGAGDGVPGNVEFHLATIDKLPLPDASVDCVISNCVINLAPDKSAVFREIARVLKPGGRLAISDIALKQTLPPELAENVLAYVGCIAGAIPIPEYRAQLLAAGLEAVEVMDTGADLNAYARVEGASSCCSAAPAPVSVTVGGREPTAGSSPSAAGEARPHRRDAARLSSPRSDATLHRGLADLASRYNVNDYAASVRIYAVKPA